jgi:hypothetical protein
VLLNAKQALNLARDAPGRQPETSNVDVDLSPFGQLPNLSAADLAELLKMLGGHH